MNYQKQFFPDDPPTEPPPSEPVATPLIPAADMDFLTVAESVSETWTATPAITLLWKTAAQFATEVAAYRTHLTAARELGAIRPSQTFTLAQLDDEVDEAVGEVKVYIQKKWKEAATANYHRFGIVKENKAYQLPRDRDERREAFNLMIAAINEDEFLDEEYGNDYWEAMKVQYIAALDGANNTDGLRSSKVGSKNEAKDAVRKVLIALRLCLQANYPDTYESVIRDWGWQKEDY